MAGVSSPLMIILPGERQWSEFFFLKEMRRTLDEVISGCFFRKNAQEAFFLDLLEWSGYSVQK
jgi:hypothetical protein